MLHFNKHPMSDNTHQAETFAFQAEINQLLSLIINAFYSNKDVFLRELISNASDALDKIRYEGLTNSDVYAGDANLNIKIIPDRENKTLTIIDNGIGMTRDELIKNLGTIAHSGTRSFMEALQTGKQPDVSLIGQFGVGFYSAYLVADRVVVVSKSATSSEAHQWESNASGSFTVAPVDVDPDFVRGTKITLYMKDDQLDYLEAGRLKAVIHKHNGYCSFPISCLVEKEEQVDIEEDEEVPKDEGVVEDVSKEQNTTKKTVKTKEFEQVNKQQPIWLRKPEDVERGEYAAFYKSFGGDWEDPMHYKHFSVDGSVQFKALLYIPKRPPYDMFMERGERKRDNIKLYVKKVLIMDETNDLMPEYLSFVKGVVDSDDLPLNVSREMLQQNNVMRLIKKNLVKKAIEMMQEIAEGAADTEDKKNWPAFYKSFGTSIKLGIHEDTKNREKLSKLLRFTTSASKDEEDLVSLSDYVARMKDGQKNIYYITGENVKAVRSSPFIQKLVKKGIEVIFMTDPMDEYMVQNMQAYDDKPLVCCSKEGLEIEESDDAKKVLDERKGEWQPVCDKIKSILGEQVAEVRITDILDETTPCVLTTSKYGWSANMERLMKAQALNNNASSMGFMHSRKTLEINPDHPILIGIRDKVTSNDKALDKIVNLLYETVLIDSGFTVVEPSKYAQKIYRLINLGIRGDSEDEVQTSAEEDTITEKIDDIALSAPESCLEEVD